MQNYIDSGERVEYVATADTAAGDVVVIAGSLIVGISIGDVLNAGTGVMLTKGTFKFPKNVTQALGFGVSCYWDNTNKNITTTVGSNILVGYATSAQLAADTTCYVKLK